jgi:hypothetical protein
MKGDRVEIVVDTGHGTSTFEITASRAGRRLEVTTARGVVEVTEVTRGGTPVRTGRFMATRVVALVEHPALEATAGVDVETRRRMGSGTAAGSSQSRSAADPVPRRVGGAARQPARDARDLLAEEATASLEPDLMDELRRIESADAPDAPNVGE